MLLDLILILVVAVFAILTGAALLGAGAFVVASLTKRRKAIQAAKVARDKAAVAAERAHPGDDLMGVADAVAEDPQPTLREERIPVPARPNALGGWVRIGDERVHRSCEQAYPAGLVCSYCLPILLVHARSVTP